MTNLRKFVAIGVVAIVLIVGVLAYSVLRTPAEATAPITAIPLADNAGSVASPSAAAPSSAPVTTTEAATPAPADSSATTESPSPAAATAESPSPAAATDVPAGAATSASILAEIVQDESQARFVIDEVLNDAPKTVIGITNQVAGEITVDPQDPTKTRVGTIQVNARTLATDSNFRDRAIKNRILNTDQYEFVTFAPTEIKGLPQGGSVGQSYTFQIVGDLTIRDVTKPVTFDVTATPVSETRLEGKANTTIRYADWGLVIPQVRQVASVSDDVRLEIDFVAVPK